MVKFLIGRPIAVIMMFIAAVVLGIVAYSTIPVSLMPDIPIPEVTVHIVYKNSSSRELENTIVKQLRIQLLQVGHLSEINSEARNGQATVLLKFNYGTNINLAFIEVNEKIDAAMNSLPRDLDRPRVVKASTTDIPIFYLNLSLKSGEPLHSINDEEADSKFLDLSEFAESVIRKRIEQLPEVAMVDMSGTVSSQLAIQPDLQKMQSLNFSIQQLENSLAQNNVNAGNILVRDGHYQYNIRFSTVLSTVSDVEKIYIKTSGKIFQLKDIAKVSLEPQPRTGMFAANTKPAISMAIIKQADAKLSNMKDKIRDMVTTFEKDYPGIHFEASQDQTQLLEYSITNLKQNLSQGLLLVILVVFLFLKDMKAPLLIGSTLIVSIVVSMLFFSIMHLSINIISLAGLILAVGNMMDNSIVVTDNITQYREIGYSIDDACITGTNEVIVPMLSSMFTNVAVFVPLIFLSGIAGALFYDQAMSVAIGLSVSYVVGITLMPVIYRIAYKKVYTVENKISLIKDRLFNLLGKGMKRFFDLDKIYTAGLNFTFRHKRTNILIYLLMLPIGVIVVFAIKKEKMPSFPQTEVIINIDWNENIHVAENKRRVYDLLNALKAKTQQSNSFIGHQQFLLNRDQEMSASESRIYIKTNDPSNIEWIKDITLKYAASGYSRAIITFDPPTSIFEKLFTTNEAPLIAQVSMVHRESQMDIPALLDICGKLNEDKSLHSINKIPLEDHIVLSVDMGKLLIYKVSYDAITKELRMAFRDDNIGTLRSFQQYIPIVVTSKEKSVTDIINTTSILNEDNSIVPLNALLHIFRGQDMKRITAGKDGEYVSLVYSPTSANKDHFTEIITSQVTRSKKFDVQYFGSVFTSIKLLNEMGIILIISVLLLYFILAAQFESLIQPFLVLLEIPIDFSAALLVLYVTGQTLNLMSAIGMIIMTGIIINDSILKLDVINQLRKEGYPLMQAIFDGGHRRLRAILMTSLTSILAMIPLLFSSDLGSELQKPFSYSLIGGMVIGTLVSLYLVPLIYWYIYRKENGMEMNNEENKLYN